MGEDYIRKQEKLRREEDDARKWVLGTIVAIVFFFIGFGLGELLSWLTGS